MMFREVVSLHDITLSTWNLLVGSDPSPAPVTVLPNLKSVHLLLGAIQVLGQSELTIVVQCSFRLAQRIASAMIGLDEQELNPESIQDSCAELTNVIGGTVKNKLVGDTQLSLPSIMEGTGLSISFFGSRVLERQHYICDGEPLVVVMSERIS